MNPNTRRRLAAGLGAVLAGAGATVLVPTAAQAAEHVQSSYNVGCTLYPDDASGSSEHPAGVAHDGPRNDVTASPLLHEITARASARFSPSMDEPAFREDCFAGTDYSDLLTVGAGTSGLSEGDAVPVAIAVRVRGSLDELWGSDASFSTRAEYRAEASLVSVDDCTAGGGLFGGGESVTVCEEPMRFELERDRTVYGTAPGTWAPNGSVDLYYGHSYELMADG